jgi:glycosyltransferase involved in cell wall biosynthesis
MKVAIVVIDGNDVSGEHRKKCAYPSPSLHPAIHFFLEGLAKHPEIEIGVFFGAATPPDALQASAPNLQFFPIAYKRVPIPGMGGALLGRFLALRKAVRDWRPDLVHGQGTEREAGLVAAFAGLPSVLTLHGNFREIEKIFRARPLSYYWVAARLETLVLRRIKHVICISQYVKNLVNPFSCEKSVIPNPVGWKFLNHLRPQRAKPPRVVCMGTIDARKNTQFILRACERLWNEGVDFTFHIYGNAGYGSDYSNEFFAMLSPHESAGRAKFEGFVTTPAETLAAADLMVSASIEESFGMNLLEAMAVGTPCIAPNLGGMRDIIAHESTGFLYEPGNLDACVDAIRQLITNQELWNNFSINARARARAHFTPEIVAQQTLEVYRRLEIEDRRWEMGDGR